MGRQPVGKYNNQNTRCRFSPEEVAEMERLLEIHNGFTPSREIQEDLAEKFSNGDRHAPVQQRQIWNWFQNRRYKLSKMGKADQGAGPSSSGRRNTAEQLLDQRANGLQFEAISSKDGAWYDIRCFLKHKITETGPEVLVKYVGLGGDEEEWVELKSVRRRSLPCEGFECLAVYPGDNVLCFQEGDKHALYYDARVIDVRRNRHDSRGCRCRFWIRYDHDQFEEVVTLRKVCRRPETDCRLKTHCVNSDGGRRKHNQDDDDDDDRDQQDEQGGEEDEEEKHCDDKQTSEQHKDDGSEGALRIDLNSSPPKDASLTDGRRRAKNYKIL